MKKKTKQQIQDEIEKLKLLRTELNDADWSMIIKAQLNVLENKLSYDEIHGRYGQFGQDEVVLHLALYTRDWIKGRMNLLTTLQNIGYYRDAIQAELDYGFDDDEYENEI